MQLLYVFLVACINYGNELLEDKFVIVSNLQVFTFCKFSHWQPFLLNLCTIDYIVYTQETLIAESVKLGKGEAMQEI
jgi:hypothetical protein